MQIFSFNYTVPLLAFPISPCGAGLQHGLSVPHHLAQPAVGHWAGEVPWAFIDKNGKIQQHRAPEKQL